MCIYVSLSLSLYIYPPELKSTICTSTFNKKKFPPVACHIECTRAGAQNAPSIKDVIISAPFVRQEHKKAELIFLQLWGGVGHIPR